MSPFTEREQAANRLRAQRESRSASESLKSKCTRSTLRVDGARILKNAPILTRTRAVSYSCKQYSETEKTAEGVRVKTQGRGLAEAICLLNYKLIILIAGDQIWLESVSIFFERNKVGT